MRDCIPSSYVKAKVGSIIENMYIIVSTNNKSCYIFCSYLCMYSCLAIVSFPDPPPASVGTGGGSGNETRPTSALSSLAVVKVADYCIITMHPRVDVGSPTPHQSAAGRAHSLDQRQELMCPQTSQLNFSSML